MYFLESDSFFVDDIAGITMSITKHNYIVKDVNDLADTIRKAFVIAQAGTSGSILIDIRRMFQAYKDRICTWKITQL